MKLWHIGAVAGVIALLQLLYGCTPAHAQGDVPTDSGVTAWRHGNGWAGETFCAPDSIHSTVARSDVDSVETQVHEEIHRRQMRQHGCAATLALWDADPRAKMDAEAQAACLAMRAVNLPEPERRRRAVELTKWWMRWSNALSFAEIATAYDFWCGDEP